MAKIKLQNIYLDIPILDSSKRIFKMNPKKSFSDSLIGSKKVITQNNVTSRVLEDISFDAKSGDSIALIGHNGSGKTSLLRIIAGIYRPTSGQIEIDGNVSGILNVAPMLTLDATGIQNVKIIINYLKRYDVDLNKILSFIEEISGLGDFLNMPIKNYSSGMQARLIFSITLFLKSDIAIIDEGISTGDSQFRENSQNLMEEHLSSIKIKLFASHDEEFLSRNCNKAFVLKKGNLKIFDSVKDGLNFYKSENYKF